MMMIIIIVIIIIMTYYYDNLTMLIPPMIFYMLMMLTFDEFPDFQPFLCSNDLTFNCAKKFLVKLITARKFMRALVDNDDLEDGEIPSDEDDEPTPPPPVVKPPTEPVKPTIAADSPKHKNFEPKFTKNKKPSSSTSNTNNSKQDRFGKYKNPSEDWAGDVEKAIRAALEEQDRSKGQDNAKSKSRSNRSKNRKRIRDEKEEERAKAQKKRKLSDEENGNEDDDEMLFVRGASPVSRRDGHDTTRSSPRRSTERDSYDNVSENDDRSSDRRQRDNDSNKRGSNSGAGGRGPVRRGGKTERGGKNKGRGQLRNDRNGRRNQNSDHGQDPDAICLYYMQGKCHRGDDCPFSHNALPPRKMELCKFYLMDCCAKRDKCLYMHHDFPCKFFHTGLKCVNGENCKFSHEPLNEQVKNILLKHLETAPKEILGDFPRLSREGALMMINNTARNAAQSQETANQKIPSLFDVALPAPVNATDQEDEEPRGNSTTTTSNKDQNAVVPSQQKRPTSSTAKERKPAGKKTRWGSDEDRVPYEQIMLLQSVSQLGLHLPNVALGLAVQQQLQQHILIQQCIANMEFYNEIHGSPGDPTAIKDKVKAMENSDFTKDVSEEAIAAQSKASSEGVEASSKDIDLREVLNANRASAVSCIADAAANLETPKFDDESDRDEETGLVIEMPVEDEDKNKEEEKDKGMITREEAATENDSVMKETVEKREVPEDGSIHSRKTATGHVSSPMRNENVTEDQEMPPNLPKKAQELFMRIQQQQRAAKDSLAIADDKGKVEEATKDDPWYSDDEETEKHDDDDDDDDDDDEAGNLTIVLKDPQKDESDRGEDGGPETPEKEKAPEIPEVPSIPQPAVFGDKLGNLSKIDISAEVTKILSAIKPHGSKLHAPRPEVAQSSIESRLESAAHPAYDASSEVSKNSRLSTEDLKKLPSLETSASRDTEGNKSKSENGKWSPKPSSAGNAAAVSRDPRMSRDPRQRREEQKSVSPSRNESKKESRSLRLETSIYSSGITIMDANMDTDLRARPDQDHRRKDMDLRQRFQQQDFGDTDLRVVGSNFSDGSNWRSDVDLRPMLTLPFKPAPSHVPCTEIEASISSHPSMSYKVYVVDIPRPDYTGLKLTKNDAQVKYDPRLRKIFRLPKVDIADSPMSPPPAVPVKPETPKSPPHLTVRSDPRRKALETSSQVSQNISGSGVSANPVGVVGMLQGQGQSGMGHQQSEGMSAMGMNVSGMQVPSGIPGMPPMGQNPIMGGIGGPMIGGPIAPSNLPPMGMGPGPNMGGPGNGPPMTYDPRYAAQRNGGPGLLGPAPGMGYGPDVGPPSYDGPSGYPGQGNFNNFGPGPGAQDSGMMAFGPGGPNPGSFGGNVPPAEWTPANQNQMRRGGGGGSNRVRRRNRNRANSGPNNRRSPQ
ncbi:uncharacterized protein su(sable) isoform X2 [Venturia canescens]|uniref:uncharacterized protein su(sable) isoform X2 n=1 Tax=Venturia canescens TaxID=32260 RepID=UPI001C9CCC13|nr:uncharacterized protein LOC122406255 isoform X2 [Venturia canescens]